MFTMPTMSTGNVPVKWAWLVSSPAFSKSRACSIYRLSARFVSKNRIVLYLLTNEN